MQARRLGRTGHLSSVAILGGCAFADGDVEAAQRGVQTALAAGVNHLDIAPSYGAAEVAIGASLAPVRKQVFLGCKTTQRTAGAARAELEESLRRLGTDHVELYQFHAVTSHAELEAILAPGGAAEAVFAARDEGLTRFVGITGHFLQAPEVFRSALDRLDLDTVMFPVNAGHWADPTYRRAADELLATCGQRDVGVVAIKALARRPWRGTRRYATWYEPLDDPARVQAAVNFTLSLPVTGFATPCERRLLALALEAAERFEPMSAAEIESATRQADLEPLARMS